MQVRGQSRRSRRVFLCSHPTALSQIQSHSRLPPHPWPPSLGPEHCRAVYSARSVAQMFKQESDSEKEGKEGKAVAASREARERERESARKATIKLSFVGPLLPGWRARPPLTLTPSVACPLLSSLPAFTHMSHLLLPRRDLHAQKEEGEKKNRLSAPSLSLPSLMPPSHFHKYYFCALTQREREV